MATQDEKNAMLLREIEILQGKVSALSEVLARTMIHLARQDDDPPAFLERLINEEADRSYGAAAQNEASSPHVDRLLADKGALKAWVYKLARLGL